MMNSASRRPLSGSFLRSLVSLSALFPWKLACSESFACFMSMPDHFFCERILVPGDHAQVSADHDASKHLLRSSLCNDLQSAKQCPSRSQLRLSACLLCRMLPGRFAPGTSGRPSRERATPPSSPRCSTS